MLQAVNADWHDKWTMEQIQWVERRYHNLFPMILERKQELIGATNSLTNTANPSIASTVPATLSAVPPPAPVTPHSSVTPPVSLVQPTFNKPQQPQPHHNVNSQPQSQNVRFSRQATPLSIPDQTLNEHDTSTQWSRELVLLDKIYKDDDKFSGTGDNFVFKVNIYYDKCRRVGLPPDAYLHDASIMLFGQAQTYHYSNWGDTSFDGFYVKMWLFFEGPEWQRLNLTKWQTISLNDTISANSTLTTTECLCKLCTNLETIQRGLDPAYYGPVHLRENIICACKGHPALANSLTNPPPDTSELVNNLYTSIVNYETVHKPFSVQQTYVQYDDDDDDDYESWFTDRQYRKGRSNFRPSWPYGKTSSYLPARPPSQMSSRQSKKCFVCNRPGCWSIHHTQQERDNSKRQFAAKHPNYQRRPGYSQKLEQYIVHYEGTDDDDTAQFFEELLINTASDCAAPVPTSASALVSSETFLTSFGKMMTAESTNTTNILADKALKHQITSIDDTVSPTSAEPRPYSFSTSSTSRYNETEFKRLLIDSGAAVKSTGGIGQLKALQRVIPVELQETATNATNIVFGIGSASSIGTVYLGTPIGLVTFHIV